MGVGGGGGVGQTGGGGLGWLGGVPPLAPVLVLGLEEREWVVEEVGEGVVEEVALGVGAEDREPVTEPVLRAVTTPRLGEGEKLEEGEEEADS